MLQTLTAMFDRYQDASEAVTRLKAAGVPDRDISIISNDAAHRDTVRSDYRHVDDGGDAVEGAGSGAAIGGALGGGAGLLAGLGLLAIPGLGPVVAAGWLAATLVGAGVGAGVGAAAGGLVGSLVGAGITEEDAHVYAEGIRRGGTLVTVRVEESQSARIVDILDDEGTIQVDERQRAWREEGWTGRYDPSAPAVTTTARPSTPAARTTTSATSRVRSYPMAAKPGRSDVELEDNRDRARPTGTGRPV